MGEGKVRKGERGTRGEGEKGKYNLFDELAGCETTTTTPRDMSRTIHQQDRSHRTEFGANIHPHLTCLT